VVRYTDAVIIGADSKGIATSGSERTSRYECKIHILNSSLVFTHSGLTQSGNIFDVTRIAEVASKQRGTFSGVVQTFLKSATPVVLAELVRIKKTDPIKFFSEFAGKEVFAVLFVGIQDDTIRMHKQVYSCIATGDSTTILWQTKNCPPTCTDNGYVEPLAGTKALRDSVGLSHLLSLGPIHTINSLIGLDAILSPETIAGPIDILLFTHRGPLWLQKKTECN